MKHPLSLFLRKQVNITLFYANSPNMSTGLFISFETVMMSQSNIFFLRDGHVCRTYYFFLDNDDMIHFNIESTNNYRIVRNGITSLINIFPSKKRGLVVGSDT